MKASIASRLLGAMLAVNASAEELQRFSDRFTDIQVNNYNSNSQTVLGGSKPLIAAVRELLEQEGFKAKVLDVANAFHTDFVRHAAAPLTEKIAEIASYKQLAEVNVKGVGEVIEFCLAGYILLAHISSYSVMGNKAYHSDFVFKENHFNVGQRFDYQYYEKSQWDGEKRIHQARKKGLQAVILRLGDVFGDSQTGCYTLTQTTNRSIYYEILKTIVDTGLFFFSTDPLFLTPVNYVAKSSLYLALTPEVYGNTYYLANSQVNLMYEFVNHLIDFSYRVRIIPFRDYLIILKKQAIKKDGKPYLLSFNNLMVYSEKIVGLDRMVSSTIGRDTLAIDTTQARKMLAKPNIICPKIDSELMAKYLRYCIYRKYIPAPSHQTPLAKIIM